MALPENGSAQLFQGWVTFIALFLAGAVIAGLVPHDEGVPLPWNVPDAAHPIGNLVVNILVGSVYAGFLALVAFTVVALVFGRAGRSVPRVPPQ
jgi:hypothetical protein